MRIQSEINLIKYSKKQIIGNYLFKKEAIIKIYCDELLYNFGFKQIVIDLVDVNNESQSRCGIVEINDHFSADTFKTIGVFNGDKVVHICSDNKLAAFAKQSSNHLNHQHVIFEGKIQSGVPALGSNDLDMIKECNHYHNGVLLPSNWEHCVFKVRIEIQGVLD